MLMLKQPLFILLISSLSILFLIQVILPHHHHEGIPHFEWEETQYPDPEENNTLCQLDQLMRAVLKTEENCHCLICCTSHDHADLLLQAVLLTFTYDITSSEKEEILPPYLNNYHPAFASRSLSLRAPPVV
jgi:hypothetical protein